MTNYLRMAMSEGFTFEDTKYAGYPSKDQAVIATKDAFSQLASNVPLIQTKINCEAAVSDTKKQVDLWQWVTTANTKSGKI